MAKIKVTNPKQIINGGAKKYYFKVKGVGGIKGDKGDKGDTGSQGPQGPQGNAATIMVGSTTTLPTGYDATVTNTGTINNAILNFGIPRGIKGDTGAKGDKGDRGDKGEQGNTGPQGPAGQNATVYVGTTTTGAPGTQASVYNSGTDRNAVLNFTIPQGAKGDTGATGSTGPQGPAGQDGQNFTPTVVDSLPATGDQTKLYLTPKDYTTGTASGNPITISLGEEAGQITSAQLDGDTYQQSYTGKNLLNSEWETGAYSSTTGAKIGDTNTYRTSEKVAVQSDTTYVVSRGSAAVAMNYYEYGANGDYIGHAYKAAGSPITTGQTTKFITMSRGMAGGIEKMMLESGSTITAYEPYVGGVPSPNPDYPQQIQTVTGTQTVAINGTDYPIDLGSIELCKLGDYQDYIYKSGSDWKVHKATKTIHLKDITWLASPTSDSGKYRMRTSTAPDDILAPANNNTKAAIKSSVYGVITSGDTYAAIATGISVQATTPHIFIYDPNYNTASSPTAFTQKMANTNATAYYALATATDTVITDAVLIAQLEAVRTTSLQASNTITNTATGSNLAGDLELGYYEYDPTNRYDKWLWLDLNNHYEKLGS